jgi:hypothetical protein
MRKEGIRRDKEREGIGRKKSKYQHLKRERNRGGKERKMGEEERER